MIYLLVKDSEGYDDCDRPIFAHSDKAVVEAVHEKLMQRHKRLHRIAKDIQPDLEKLYEANPMPEGPDLKKLPPRPLVWDERTHSWQNAYMIDYLEECKVNREKVSKWSDEIIDLWAKYYGMTAQEKEEVFAHTSEVTYSVDEIEDDPDKI